MANNSGKRFKAVRTPKIGRSSKKKNTAEKELLHLSYRLGQIQRGMKNSESKIAKSYAKGNETPEKRQKRSLF